MGFNAPAAFPPIRMTVAVKEWSTAHRKKTIVSTCLVPSKEVSLVRWQRAGVSLSLSSLSKDVLSDVRSLHSSTTYREFWHSRCVTLQLPASWSVLPLAGDYGSCSPPKIWSASDSPCLVYCHLFQQRTEPGMFAGKTKTLPLNEWIVYIFPIAWIIIVHLR